ncbi:MAG: tRNA guanosine(34) transglycosylase Tgt [Candidatus Omnitrophica bacterium]|nr:tRNA guanosine(34) transglycosylase Tgt [Candidatus Omnitrophota bacterium]
MSTLKPKGTRYLSAKRNLVPFEFGFEILNCDSQTRARTGIVHTPHGDFETPVFMPVGTQGTVKALAPRDLKEAGTEILLSNAYHLFVRPGIEVLKRFGGLHKFMAWDGPLLTDSGGFQVFSLSRLREITEEGVKFHSHFDGAEIFFTPEKVIEIQEIIGSDIAMIFDDCPPATRERSRIQKSLDLTIAWSKRAKKHHRLQSQALFGIIQGGTFKDLRLESLERTVEIGFDGYALGGLCVGEAKEETFAILEEIIPRMPEPQPRYLMGIGTPIDFLEAVDRGADMFDCVNPTRYGRNGAAFTREGLVVVRNAKYQADPRPLMEDCPCYACRNFSRAYLRHLLNTEEMLGPELLSLHNVTFFVQFVKEIREKIKAGKFAEYKKNFLKNFDPNNR